MKEFGGKLNSALVKRYQGSPNWRDGKFQNLVETTMSINIQSIPKLLYKQFFVSNGRTPKKSISILGFDNESFLAPSDLAKMIWYGHSAVLLRINSLTVLIDPMLGSDTSPTAPFTTKRFSEDTLQIIDTLPAIDLVLLTHDHYDHLDYSSIQKLKKKTTHYFVALGVGRHLKSWGIEDSAITEFDWWDNRKFKDLSITFTPTRHFSGRGLTDRSRSLWGGWVLRSANENIYFSGDSGYGEHFKTVGKELGPFDFGLMECGQYNEQWHQIHMFPEESVQAASDAMVKKTMAVHWGAFALSQHHWKDPIQRYVQEAANKKVNMSMPQLGQMFTAADDIIYPWWDDYE